jgi:hypothetical protein
MEEQKTKEKTGERVGELESEGNRRRWEGGRHWGEEGAERRGKRKTG